jgi:hypothetical protein
MFIDGGFRGLNPPYKDEMTRRFRGIAKRIQGRMKEEESIRSLWVGSEEEIQEGDGGRDGGGDCEA